MVLSVFDDWYSVRIVKNSQKTVKQQKMTIGAQIVTCLNRLRRIHKAAQTPLPRETSITCAWAVATARRPWAGLTLCVYMDVHASGSRSLPRAATATLSSTYCDACSSSGLSTIVIKFSIFSDLANFLVSRPNSVEYGNSKTTTFLHSAKCTRPLFQGRTGCGGRPSGWGWHDIVTCQRLVLFSFRSSQVALYVRSMRAQNPSFSARKCLLGART